MLLRIVAIAAIVAAITAGSSLPVSAGTTGGLHGRVLDSTSGAPIAGVRVTATSPSQAETALTDAGGEYVFLSLSPDTYTLTASKDGYNPATVSGITVIADQTHAVDLTVSLALKTLGTVVTRSSASLVKPGMTSDVYSVNAAGQRATASLAGSGSLNSAYGAAASVPGVIYQQGQQGWYQSIYIRGGDNDETAYEVDGVPVMRVSDSATTSTFSDLGQQEMQVYTGGTPASADASGIAGYINQVIKTGTYPGYSDMTLGIGAPAFYNSIKFEAGGATPNRGFSYYLGQETSGEDFRYGDQFNGASDPLFFFPMGIPTNAAGIYDGAGPTYFAPGPTYAVSNTTDTETIANIHIQVPHKSDSYHDDIQMLYQYSNLLQDFYSSVNDLGLNVPSNLNTVESDEGFSYSPLTYVDQFAYNGPVFAPPDDADVSTQLFPNSGSLRPAFQDLPAGEREGSQNGSALAKLQFQKNIDPRTYLRVFGYSDYSWWFISGPVSANLNFGDQLPDYEVIGHTYGADAIFSKQLSDKHLLNVTTSYFTSKLQTYSMGFQTGFFTSLIDSAGNCYNPGTGVQTSCFDGTAEAGPPVLAPAITAPAGTPVYTNDAQWIVTENGQNAQVDNVHPDFSAVSVTDSWRPNDKISANLGLRVENFRYDLQNLEQGFPARAFWFHAYNNENCFGPGYLAPVQRTFDPVTGAESACPSGTTPTDLQNTTGGVISQTVPQPRLGLTDELDPDTVVRISYGRYARPAPTSYQEYNAFQQDLPSFIGTFLNSGWNTPAHYMYADTSDNADLSLEQHLHGTDMSYKITPFYRTTQGQIQYVSLNAQGVVAGINAGNQRSSGLEIGFNKGSFDRNGFALAWSATYTRSRIHYGPFPNGLNVIDQLNEYIQQYNSYTSACAGVAASGDPRSRCGVNGGSFAVPIESTLVTNPYYNDKPQPLFDDQGWYTTYDQIPSPFNNAIGFETPFQSTLVLNWKHGPLSISPNFVFSTQGKYGSPLVWPGYDPANCAPISGTNNVDPTSCSNYLFIPDKFTGVFDNLGAFQQPNRLSANLAISYDFTPRLSATLTAANIIDHCYQRPEPWANGSTCEYAQLASNLLAPAGNFVANPPVQLAYPYGSWYNNIEIGQIGQKDPTEATLEFTFKP